MINQTKQQITDLVLEFLEKQIYFYLSNKVIGKYSFTFHGDNIDKVAKIYPQLLEIIPHKTKNPHFAVGFIRGKVL